VPLVRCDKRKRQRKTGENIEVLSASHHRQRSIKRLAIARGHVDHPDESSMVKGWMTTEISGIVFRQQDFPYL
jgi:hypothetical protein